MKHYADTKQATAEVSNEFLVLFADRVVEVRRGDGDLIVRATCAQAMGAIDNELSGFNEAFVCSERTDDSLSVTITGWDVKHRPIGTLGFPLSATIETMPVGTVE